MSSSSRALTAIPKNAKPLAILEPSKESTPVIVKLLRKWYVWPSYGGNKPNALEVVFVDSEGTTIQGHIDRMHIYKHDRQLHEGHVYIISKYEVALNVGKFRATRHSYKMTINLNTLIRPAARNDSIQGPEVIFTPPAECFERGFNMDYLVDIIGILVGVQAEYEFSKPSGKSSRMKIDLENRGYRFSVTLFGEYVRQLKEFISAGDVSNAVVALLWCKVDTWLGGVSLQTTMHTTRLLINPDIPEASALKECMSQDIMSPTLTITQHSRSGGPKDDFLLVKEKHEISDVKELEHVSQFVVLATVDGISTEKPWWYWACKCHKKVVEDSGMYYCEKCNTHVTIVSKKYFLTLSVINEAESVDIVVFDQNVRALIERSCDDVYNSWIQDAERDDLPTEVKGLIGKEVLIKVEAQGTASSRYGRQYKAVNISDDRELINQYQLKWADAEAPGGVLLIENTLTADSDSVTNNVAEVAQDLISKFEQSSSGSNTTDKGKQVIDITKDSDDTPPLKRKTPSEKEISSVAGPLKAVKIEKKP